MSILKIARMGHPVLARRAEEVADPTARAVRQLVEDMVETMRDANGAGLAAPQVHVSRRVVVFHAPAERDGEAEAEDADGAAPLTVLINPVVEPLGEDKELGWEGCLSVPGMTGAVPRFTRIRYGAMTPTGQRIEREASGFHARVVQHECDHLDGILYPMRIEDMSLFGFDDEIRRRLAAARAAEQRAEAGDAEAGDAEPGPGDDAAG